MAKPFHCRRCGGDFKWAIDLAAHTAWCPMPPPPKQEPAASGEGGDQ